MANLGGWWSRNRIDITACPLLQTAVPIDVGQEVAPGRQDRNPSLVPLSASVRGNQLLE
jgi:hypothetical protein